MSEAEWRDGDDPKVRALFGYALRSHVTYQDGRHSEAPALVFADYDYEVGDGACGLHADGKSANEPAIVYVRADALIDAHDRLATARNDALEEARTKIREHSDIARRKLSECYDTGDGDAAAIWGAIISHLDIAHDTIRALKSETKP